LLKQDAELRHRLDVLEKQSRASHNSTQGRK
jgi:hypothetical protein